MVEKINTGNHTAGIVNQGDDIYPAFAPIAICKLRAEGAVAAPDFIDMRTFITPHVAVGGRFQFRLYLSYEAADCGFGYLPMGDGPIIGELPEDGGGRHTGVTGFEITDLLLEIGVKLAA